MKLFWKTWAVACVASVLAACGGGEESIGASANDSANQALARLLRPATPANLAVTYGVKSYVFSWDAAVGATRYELFEDPDGPGHAKPALVAGAITTTTYTLAHAVLLSDRLNAQYAVRACNAGGCSAPTVVVQPDLTRAIGFFKASNTGEGDSFGYRVAVSSDGSTLAVSAPGENGRATGVNGNQADDGDSMRGAGAVYVFVRNSGVWVQQAYVKASNTGAPDTFGVGLSLSADGNTLAVGAPSEPGASSGINGEQSSRTEPDAGAVYVFTRQAGTWSQQAYVKASNASAGDAFGLNVALSATGNLLAVSARDEDSGASGVGANQADDSAPNAGAVYLFTREGTAWSQQAYLKASNAEAGDEFGAGLALSADGRTLAVGAGGESSSARGVGGSQADNSLAGAGAVYVFVESRGSWRQQAYIKASNPDRTDSFGSYVALSADGDTLAVSTPSESSGATGINGDGTDNFVTSGGAAYVFRRAGIVWAQQAYIKPSNTHLMGSFGTSVALSADGDKLAVGAAGDQSSARGIGGDQTPAADGSSSGAVFTFERLGRHWHQEAFIKPSNTDLGHGFGMSVAFSADAKLLAVGAPGESGTGTGIQGDQSPSGDHTYGAMYLY